MALLLVGGAMAFTLLTTPAGSTGEPGSGDSVQVAPVAAVVESGAVPAAVARAGDAYLRGAHWFGDGWAVNFWNTDLLAVAREDFTALKADGFNAVVLVIPWPGFAADRTDGRLVPERTRRLGELIDLAAAFDLDVVVRIGYAWDSAVEAPEGWLLDMWHDPRVYQGWLDYIQSLWDAVGERDNVKFGFICWEDLWAVTWMNGFEEPARREMAQAIGYRDWLSERVTLEQASDRYGVSFTGWSDVPLPRKDEPAYGWFLEFLDYAWIERFFKPAQARFPSLSMEIRIDSDPVLDANGEFDYWHSHEAAWDLPGAPWTTIYWSPAMGGLNQGEQLAPETAVERLQYMLERVRAVTGTRPIFIDQYLVEDFTPGFENNGRIATSAVPDFLEQAAPVMAAYAQGYALWTWKDYRHDAIPSPDFSIDAAPWTFSAGVDDTPAPGLALDAGQGLARSFGIGEFHAPGGPEAADLCVVARAGDGTTGLTVVAPTDPDSPMRLPATGERECVAVDVADVTRIELQAEDAMIIDSLVFSGFTQPSGIREVGGQRKPVATDWVRFNQALEQRAPAPFQLYPDGWMGKALDVDLDLATGADLDVVIETTLPTGWPFQPVLAVQVDGQPVGEAICGTDEPARFLLPDDVRNGRARLTLTVDRLHQPEGDERYLGCQVLRVQTAPSGAQ
ncbi:hypothetical protein F3N42_05425 [Marinihelvus fidelis]|uniref:Uncharacterized protein n=1 Tax=Marinihelvus fidelis TaxID=2613842 RepID=A0A5N0TCH0_9GAMM|nr:hypothetical protein [Marinihelvus fidelis]KAA9132660.1 hypothetical protein F3N42_05425 [Marinihelvus fidelis]